MPIPSLEQFIHEVVQTKIEEVTSIFEPKRHGLPADQLGLISNGGAHNIKTVYNQATPDEKDYWGKWYHNAKAEVENLAQTFKLPFPVVAAITAVLSPGNKWGMNLLAAERLLQGAAKVNAYPKQRERAQKILETGDVSLVTGPKVTVFFNSLLNPTEVEKEMVLDSHAINIWKGQKLTIQDTDAPGEKLRMRMVEDYKTAAKELGVPVQAVQAVTWYIWKYTHPSTPIKAASGVYDVSTYLKGFKPANDTVPLEEQANAVGMGGGSLTSSGQVGGTGGSVLAVDMDKSHKLMWSGEEPMSEGSKLDKPHGPKGMEYNPMPSELWEKVVDEAVGRIWGVRNNSNR